MTDERSTGSSASTPAPAPVRVVVVDDHPLVRTGLIGLVRSSAPDLEIVGEAGDGAEAVEVALDSAADVVLMDLSMPGVDGVAGTRALFARGFEGAVVVLSSFADTSRVREALEAGAIGYLLKDSDPEAVLVGIRSAALGHAPLDPRVARALLPRAGDSTPGGDLSAREREVLGLIAQGRANKQIARELGISERTVKVHASNVFRRIGVQDRTSAAMWARDNLDR
ncbi:response regulator transcription factor [Nocardioidaceae bacterium]|nr:response regulator transcription factor [Nocardioidaceae bacterium]